MNDRLISRDAAALWHPFTQHGIEKTAIPISHAKNETLFTTDGTEIIDSISSWWTITHGHNHPTLNEALHKQANTLPHVMFAGFTHEPAINLAEKLIALNDHHFNKVFYADNGSSAVEVALKLAYQYHYNQGHPSKKIFLSFQGGYHGDTFGAMATGQTTGFYDPFKPLLCQTIAVPFAAHHNHIEDTLNAEKKALLDLEKTLHHHQGEIACMIIEPLMQGASGMRICRPEFINQVCSILKSHNILIIFDEIATGFGRTGTMFAHQQCIIKPDIMCVSKGLTGGYMPLSAALVTQNIFDAFLDTGYKKSFTHGHSFTANPLACAVACANIDLFTQEKTLIKIQDIQKCYQNFIPQLQNKHSVTNIRTLGSLLAWDISDDIGDYKTKKAETLKNNFLENGYNLRPLGKTFYWMPPYCIKNLKDHLETMLGFF